MTPRRKNDRTHESAGTTASEPGDQPGAAGSMTPPANQPPLPFPDQDTEQGLDPGTEPSVGEDIESSWVDPPHQENELVRTLMSYRAHLVGLLSDVLAHHEVCAGRSQLARALAPGRAQAVLAAITLDHVVLPRWLIQSLLESYITKKDMRGGVDGRMEELYEIYRSATGWTP